MSRKNKEENPTASRGLVKMAALVITLMLAGGGMVAGGLFAAGMMHVPPADKKLVEPQLVLKADNDPYAPKDDKPEAGSDFVHGEGGSKYRTRYYSFEDEFTSNLKHSNALVQVSLAASTRRDGRVLMWLREYELAIRSRILIELGNTEEAEILTPGGKEELQKRLAKAINEVLVQEEGFGGVDGVYFRSFIIQ
ncbi:MAG: flagellar basal body-associated protein FliL [Sphingomonadaceae bacterium]